MEIPPITPFSDFENAVATVLDFLHQKIGFKLWMFTRTEEENWIVLSASDHGYGVKPGDVFRWSDSFCSRMVRGLGPRIATNCDEIEVYREAPIGQIVPIGAYIGIPLCHQDGSLFGTLCAIDPERQPETIRQEEMFIELQTKLLTTILHNELQAQNNARLYERARKESEMDWIEGIYNAKGWRKILDAEELRCKIYGDSASIIIVDIDNLKIVNDTQGHQAGDRLIEAVGRCLLKNVRQEDFVARFGGDEFGILILNQPELGIVKIVTRIEEQLAAHSISASIGWAKRSPKSNLMEAFRIADQKMYEQKKERKLSKVEITHKPTNNPKPLHGVEYLP